ncbi:MAG: hypothetical protein IID39_05140 [Planctomycetes bacterium]|nr:hypothetical protein [Planctomycetota bacterium]
MAYIVSARVLRPNPVVVGPADWTYDLLVNFPGGVQLVTGIRPSDERPDPSVMDARSVAPNSVVIGLVDGDVMQWFFNEKEAFAPCVPPGG